MNITLSRLFPDFEAVEKSLKVKKESIDVLKIKCEYKITSGNDNTVWRMRNSRLKIVKPLQQYLPSAGTQNAKDCNFSTKSLTENHTQIIRTFLSDKKLTVDNIYYVYKMLLEMEDITYISEYLPLALTNVHLKFSCRYMDYWFSIKKCSNIKNIINPFMDEAIVIPKEKGGGTSAFLNNLADVLLKDKLPYCNLPYHFATVNRIEKHRVYFEANFPNNLESLKMPKYDIIFRPLRYTLRYQHQALELLARNEEMRQYLLPKKNVHKRSVFLPKYTLDLFNTAISSNPEQLEAVHHITEGPNINAPFIILGPPGTGKTSTIVESILQLRVRHPSSRILVTAGSNFACDTIALRICKYLENNPRISHQNCFIRIYSKNITQKGTYCVNSELLPYSNYKNGAHIYPSVEEIKNYYIVITSLSTVGKYVTGNVGKWNLFTHIFIDEAGASTIPESLVGVMGVNTNAKSRLILSGDHKQLGPILKSKRAASLGLQMSLIEILMKIDCYAVDEDLNYDHTLQTRLRRNYRSHSEIVRLFNHLYYDNELIAEASGEYVNLAAKWSKLPNPEFPIIFQAVHGVLEKNDVSTSSSNDMEVGVVMWFLRCLLRDGINGQKVNPTDIGVITPYKLQNERIQKFLVGYDFKKVETGPVESFQGREKQIIIASLVRSFSNLGFVAQRRRLNVLLSRAQSLLIMIGNPTTLKRNSDLAFIIEECKKHGTFLCRKNTPKSDTKL